MENPRVKGQMWVPGKKVSPSVSIIIPTYNMGGLVCEAIGSVLKQTFRSFELIVVDDGSTDDTSLLIEPLRGSLTYIYQMNGGESSARNVGIRKANGEFISFLDADDLWLPQKLELQVEVLNDNPDIGMVTCGAARLDGSGKFISDYVPRNFTNHRDLLEGLCISQILPGSCSGVLVRRECLEAVGGFDEGIKIGPDWDIWLRIARRFKVHFIERPLVVIRTTSGKPAFRNLSGEEYYVSLVIEKSVEEKYRKRAYANLYYRIGSQYLAEGKRALAVKYLVRSFLKWPFEIYPPSFKEQNIPLEDFRTYLIVKALMPKCFVDSLRRLKMKKLQEHWRVR